jgi:hypothetical protein
MVYRSLAVIVKHFRAVGMGIGIAVKFADIGDIRFAPVRMALCADTCHSCQPMYSSFVTFRMADFCGIGKLA